MSEYDRKLLRVRVESAERRARISSIIAGLSLALIAVLTLSGWVGQEDTVTARRFEVVNKAGDVTATLEASPGGGQLALIAEDGRMVEVAADNAAEIGMRVYDSDHARVQLTVGEDGTPALRFSDSSRSVRLAASVLDEGPGILLYDAASTRRAELAQTKMGPSLRLFDTTGEPRALAGVGTDGPVMAITSSSGRTIWAAP